MRKQIVVLLMLVAIPVAAASTLDLTGSVTDEGGRPLAAAKIYVYTAVPKVGVSAVCPSCYVDCGKYVDAATDGSFRIRNVSDASKFRLLATADGYEPALSEHLAPGTPFTLRLRPRSSADASRLVRGCVVDAEGRAIRGAVVARQAVRMGAGRIGYGEIPGTEPLSITDERGEFALRVMNAQMKLDVRVRARGFAPKLVRELVPGEPPRTITVDVGGTIVGRVAHRGRPLAGVPVTFTQPDRNSHFYLGDDQIGTNDEGRFLMTGLGTDTEYAVYVAMEASTPLTVPIATVTTGADGSTADVGDLTAVPGRRISGCVNAGLLPPGTRVSLTRRHYDIRTAEVGSDGAFTFDGVPDEPVRLTVHARGHKNREIEIPPHGNRNGIVLPLQP